MKKILIAVLLLMLALCVTVTALAADKFAFEEKNVTVFEGEEMQLVLVREGKYAEGDNLTFTSNNTRVASVAADGTVTGLQKGDATITCTLKNDKGATQKRCTIAVKVARKVTSVVLNTKKLSVYEPDDETVVELMEGDTEYPVIVVPIGKTLELTATASPDDASSHKVLFETSDPSIAVIQNTSVLKGTKAGECELTAYSKQNPEVTDVYHLIVVQPVNKLTIVSDSKNVNVGSTMQLDVDFQPANASMKKVIWSTENSNVAQVDEYGTVTAIKRGTATIKATAADGSGKAATISLNVQQGPESITFMSDDEVIDVGASKKLTATVLPSNTNNKNVTWSSTDSSVATVTKNGTVKGISVGNCSLICTCDADPGVYAAINLQVQQPVTKITFTEANTTVDVGSTTEVSWNVLPANATNPAVTLKSSNERIATVDQYGTVTGVKKGSCKITATATDGSKRSGSITVKVTQPVEGVYFRQDIYHVQYHDYNSIHAYTTPKDADNQAMSWYTDDPNVLTVGSSHTKSNAVTLYGKTLGSTTFYAVTDDGGFSASATAVVDHYNDPVVVTDLYLNDNAIKIRMMNQTGMNLTRVFFTVEVYDQFGVPLACNTKDGTHCFTGYYLDTLTPRDYSQHGRFRFENFVQPTEKIGGVILRITGYRTDDVYTLDGTLKEYSLNLSQEKQIEVRFPSNFVPAEPVLEETDTTAPDDGGAQG